MPVWSRQQPGSACEECRKRKLRCDRNRPQCGTCADAGVTCEVGTSRLRRGPKKGGLKALRSRVGTSIESLLYSIEPEAKHGFLAVTLESRLLEQQEFDPKQYNDPSESTTAENSASDGEQGQDTYRKQRSDSELPLPRQSDYLSTDALLNTWSTNPKYAFISSDLMRTDL